MNRLVPPSGTVAAMSTRRRGGLLVRVAMVVALLSAAACSSGDGHERRQGEVSPPATAPSATATGAPGGLSPADDWLTFHHDSGRSGAAGDAAPLGAVKKAWRSPELDGKIYAQPLVAGDHVGEGAHAFRIARGGAVSLPRILVETGDERLDGPAHRRG